jgi:hypothetical protein
MGGLFNQFIIPVEIKHLSAKIMKQKDNITVGSRKPLLGEETKTDLR